MEVAPVISGERFGNDHGRHLRWPDPASAKLRKAGALPNECADSTAIKNQVHALRRPFRFCCGAVDRTESAHVVAAKASSGPMGPSLASS